MHVRSLADGLAYRAERQGDGNADHMNGVRLSSRAVWRTALVTGIMVLVTVGWALAQQRQRRLRGGRRLRNILEAGQLAPDFELPVLRFEKGKKGELVGKITDRRIKLSSFRRKQSVVVFFSSYT